MAEAAISAWGGGGGRRRMSITRRECEFVAKWRKRATSSKESHASTARDMPNGEDPRYRSRKKNAAMDVPRDPRTSVIVRAAQIGGDWRAACGRR